MTNAHTEDCECSKCIAHEEDCQCPDCYEDRVIAADRMRDYEAEQIYAAERAALDRMWILVGGFDDIE